MVIHFNTNGERLGDASVVIKGGAYVMGGGTASRNYDVFPGCKRFLMVKQQSDPATSPRIVVVRNWQETLKRLVPVKP